MSYDIRQDEYPEVRDEAVPEPYPTGTEVEPAGAEAEVGTEPEAEAGAEPEPAGAEAEVGAEPEPAGAEPEPVGAQAGPADTEPEPVGEGAPAATAAAVERPASVWPEAETGGFQERWRELQLNFVDDPRAATGLAEALVAEALDRFTTALTARKRELDAWRAGGGTGYEPDTEQLRVTLRHYRQLLDRLLDR